MNEEQIQLRQEIIDSSLLKRGDVVLAEADLWQCSSQSLMIFTNLDSRAQKHIPLPRLSKIAKLELIPRQWTAQESKVLVRGQELGLGPVHEVEVIGMRQFEELEMVKRQMEAGKRQDYKVVLLETLKPKTYLIVAVELLI